MTIRTFQPGDDVAQVSIYNEAAGELPRFKPASLDEVRRRCRDADFDPTTRFYAIAGNRPVGYATFQHNGRISFPWCRKGHELFAEPLLDRVLASMQQRGMRRAFAAYRGDWPLQLEFFLAHGFQQTREVINYAVDLVEMPTPAARTTTGITPLTPADLPAVLELGAGVLRVTDLPRLETQLFRNPYYPPESLFALRGRDGGRPVAVGLLVTHPDYALPKQLDGAMPCYRLGAFGSEELSTKRINGMFSFLAADNPDLMPHGLDLLTYATGRLESTTVETFAAQAPSNAPHLTRFYKSLFRRQGGFPVLERDL
jgi:hypothetical protein